MSFMRAFARTARPANFQSRQALQRRFASTHPTDPTPGLQGTADNAFNRERAAVKAHAASTSGESLRFPGSEHELTM